LKSHHKTYFFDSLTPAIIADHWRCFYPRPAAPVKKLRACQVMVYGKFVKGRWQYNVCFLIWTYILYFFLLFIFSSDGMQSPDTNLFLLHAFPYVYKHCHPLRVQSDCTSCCACHELAFNWSAIKQDSSNRLVNI